MVGRLDSSFKRNEELKKIFQFFKVYMKYFHPSSEYLYTEYINRIYYIQMYINRACVHAFTLVYYLFI